MFTKPTRFHSNVVSSQLSTKNLSKPPVLLLNIDLSNLTKNYLSATFFLDLAQFFDDFSSSKKA